MRYKIAEWTAQLAVRSVFICQRVGFVNFPSDLRHPGRQSDAIGNKLTSCRLVDKIKVKSLTVKSEILTELVSHTKIGGGH
jgi:hypothetical protein